MRSIHLLISMIMIAAFAAPQAHADDDRYMKYKGECKNMKSCGMHKKMKHQTMKERDMILLETIMLLKESSNDPAMKNRAQNLENRLQNLMGKHDEMHKKHMKWKDKKNPCAPQGKGDGKGKNENKSGGAKTYGGY